eukprot:1243348-Prymnesium_polylepis.1
MGRARPFEISEAARRTAPGRPDPLLRASCKPGSDFGKLPTARADCLAHAREESEDVRERPSEYTRVTAAIHSVACAE